MANPLIRKLEAYARLSDDDRRLLDSASQDARTVPGRTDLIREGDRPADVHLILEGFACRYKITSEGKRQIMAYLVPGDFCDLHVFVLEHMDHSIGTLSPCKVVNIPRERILALLERPRLSLTLRLAVLTDMAVLREWLVNFGQRPAEERVAHALCELLMRLHVVGLADEGSYQLPITQGELADTMGLSNVHVNRVLQKLRQAGLISWKGDVLVVPDVDRLIEFSGSNPNYLHLAGNNGQAELSL
jgi:CRP-like cAMP-binding protein